MQQSAPGCSPRQVAGGQPVGIVDDRPQRTRRHAPQRPSGGRQRARERQSGRGDNARCGQQLQRQQLPGSAETQQPRRPPAQPPAHHLAARQRVALAARGLFVAHRGVEALGLDDIGAVGPRADRQVAGDAFAIAHRRHVGTHPVAVAVLAPVLHQRDPGQARLDRGPQVAKDLAS